MTDDVQRVLSARREHGQRQAVREVERDHHAVEVVEAVAPHTEHGQGEIDLGGCEAHDGLEAADGIDGHGLRRGSARFGDLAEGLGERDPLSDRDRLGPPVAVDPNGGKRRVDARRLDRQLAGQHVVEHLPPFPEARLHDAPQAVLSVASSRSSGG